MLALCALSGCALVAPQHDAPGQSELVCRPGADAHQDAQKIPLLLRQIEDAERAGVSETGLLRLLDPLGNAYENTDRFGDAERVVSRALDIRRRIASPSAATVAATTATMVQLGIMQRSTGKLQEAIATLSACLQLAESALGRDSLEAAACMTFLGLLYTDTGAYAEAEPLLTLAVDIREKRLGAYHADTAHSINILGTLYRWLGDYPRAKTYYERTREIREKVLGPCDPYYATAVFWLAQLHYETDQLDQALVLHRQALRIREQVLSPDDHAIAHSLMGMGMTLVAMGDHAGAEPVATRGLALFERIFGPYHPRTLLNLWSVSRLHLHSGRYTEAQLLLAEGLKRSTITSVPEMQWRFQTAYQELLQRQGSTSAAIYFGKAAVNTLQSLRAGISVLGRDLQKMFIAGERSAAYRTLADLLIEQGRLPEAQRVLAMLKEDELFEFMRSADAEDVRRTQTPYTGEEQKWQQRFGEIQARLAGIGAESEALERKARGGLSATERSRRAELDRDREVGQQAFERFLGELARELDASASAERNREIGQRNIGDLQALQETLSFLGNGAVTLHYLVLAERTHIILTTPQVQLVREAKVKSADLNRMIQSFRQRLQNPERNPLPEAQALYRLLVGPVAEDLKQAQAHTLMVSLDSALRYLPMAALHDGSRYLAETYALSLYTEAAKDRLRDSPIASWQFAGLGLTKELKGFSPLPAVREELEGIVNGGILKGENHFDEDFSASRFRSVLDTRPAVLHIASHFVFAPGTEVDSFLVLGDGGRLSLADLKRYRFRDVDLITLSACETALGGGRNENGREIEGFGAMAQRQGAKSVLATLWPVADLSTGMFMQALYRMRETRMGITKADALKEVQRQFIRGEQVPKGAKDGGLPDAAGRSTNWASGYRHPFYWAPFILMGNWL